MARQRFHIVHIIQAFSCLARSCLGLNLYLIPLALQKVVKVPKDRLPLEQESSLNYTYVARLPKKP